MSELRRVRDIQISQDLDFQRREWTLQRVGWLVLLAVILLAALGACGNGLLASASRRTPNDALVLRYERVARHRAETLLQIDLRTPASDTLAVWLNDSYVHAVDVEDIVPEPESIVSGNGRITYYFATEANPTITFHIKPNKLGPRPATLGLEGGPNVRFRQFVLP
jgi:hypothetical protein